MIYYHDDAQTTNYQSREIMRLRNGKELAEELGINHRTFIRWLNEGRIVGAQMVGRTWIIPEDYKILPPKSKAGRPLKTERDITFAQE